MRKELLTLAVACLLCVPAFAADDEEPKGVSDIKEVGKVIRNPITIETYLASMSEGSAWWQVWQRTRRCDEWLNTTSIFCFPRQGQRSFLLRLPYEKA